MPNDMKMKIHTKEVVKAIDDAAIKRLHAAANLVRNTTLETLSGTRTGKEYYVPGIRKRYTASAPGEPPAVATGELRQSVKIEVGEENKRHVAIIGTDEKHGKPLEFGTIHMAARPWLRPSFEKVHDKIKAILGGRWFP